jgi:hypothetical protein
MNGELLARADAELASARQPLRSLAPGRARASTIAEILGPLVGTAEVELAHAFVDGTRAFVRAQIEAFPDNLLWDLDLPLVTWWHTARASDDPIGTATRLLGLATELQHLFGSGTTLRFRYTHDFVYGFDWAKWVARDPDLRARVGPFDLAFLEAMRARAHELIAIIEAGGDATYPSVAQPSGRNPFPFSREPQAELAIHRALAAADQIPVRAWQRDTQTQLEDQWAKPWARWREQAAARLGYATATAEARDA